MRRSLVLAALVVACGGSGTEPEQRPPGPTRPGDTVSLASALSAALGCPVADIAWTALDGGSVSPAGIYTAPACGAATFPGTFHVQATGCGKAATAEIPVQEAVLSVRVCPSSVAVAPGATVQFYARVEYSCPGHVEITPPGGTCP